MESFGQMFDTLVKEVFDIFDAIAAMSFTEWAFPFVLGLAAMKFYLRYVSRSDD